MPVRSMPVPDGLDGVRVDAALAKLLGLSRTFAAEIAESGGVQLGGRTLGKSDKLVADQWLEVAWEDRRDPEIVPIAVPELGIVFDDDDMVVVDKPAGVAAHPSVGWEDPRSWAPSRPPDTGSRRPVPRSARASCTGSTSERAA